MPPSVSTVILNHEDYSATKRCIESIHEANYPNHDVIVVNNDDNHEMADELRTEYSSIDILTTGENLGFGRGNNIGIKHALSESPDYIEILNNDAVVQDGSLSSGVEYLEARPDIGMIGGKIKYNDGSNRIWTAGGEMSWIRAIGEGRGWNEKDCGQYEDAEKVSFIPGAQLLCDANVLEEVGMFPDPYFLGGEEAELCYRVREAGHDIHYVPEYAIYHDVGYSSESTFQRYYSLSRNKQLLMKRTQPTQWYLLWELLFVTYYLTLSRVVFRCVHNEPHKRMRDSMKMAIFDHFSSPNGRITEHDYLRATDRDWN